MAIETSQAGSAHSAAVNGASHAAKGRGKAQDAAGGAGGFSSLLSGMGSLQADEDALAGVAGGVVADTDAHPGTKKKNKAQDGADAGAADAVPDVAQMAAAASSAPDAATSDQAAGGKGAAGGRAARIAGMPGASAGADGDTAAAAGKAQGADAVGRLLETSNAVNEPSTDSIAELVAGLKLPDASSGAKAGHAADPSHTPTVGLASRGDDNPLLSGARRTLHSRMAGLDPAKNANASVTSLAAINGRGTAAMADARDTKSTALSMATTALDRTSTVQLLAAAEAGGDSAASGRGHERHGGGQSFTPGALPGALADPGAASPTGAAGEPGFAAIAAGQPQTPEELLAQQVHVLVTAKTQSAELKLDGFGDQPVEVSISLNGNEAQVAFRSDHAGARELLQGAVPHLKEMLQSEGLLLSGVSVGASGQGGAEAGGRESSRGSGRGGGKPEPAAPVAAAPRAARTQGMVDVFA